jgi:hypothetical protein
MNSSTHHDRTVTIDVQIPLGATEDLDESIPADIYADWLQERFNEGLSDLSAPLTIPVFSRSTSAPSR